MDAAITTPLCCSNSRVRIHTHGRARQDPRLQDPRQARTGRIVDAAAKLFIDNGYHRPHWSRSPTAAGVAVQTVYFHFGNKRTVLKEAVDVAAVGDDDRSPCSTAPWLERSPRPSRTRIADRALDADLREHPDRSHRSCGWSATPPPVDPDMADQWATNQQQTASAFLVLAEQLDGLDALRVPVQKAVDILCAVSGLELYLQLAGRGWTPQEWERFVVNFLTHALLAERA